MLQLIRASALMIALSYPFNLAIGGELLLSPDPSAIYLLQQKFSHSTPNLKELAQTENSVRSADEFHKPAIIQEYTKRLDTLNAKLKSVDTITQNLMNNFSIYDSDNSEYDLNISDATYIYSDIFQRQVRIMLTNGTQAQTWAIKPDAAAKVLARNNGSRSVTLALTLRLLESPPIDDGNVAVLNAKILSYDILSSGSNVKLGHVNVSSE